MDSQEKFEYWLDIAQYDIESAAINFKAGRWLYVAYMSQQAIEKLVKGLYILYIDDNIPRIHNIGLLIKNFENKLKTSINDELYTFFDNLSACYFENRYPDYRTKLSLSLNKDKDQLILTKSEEVFKWLLTLKP
jgi:HEPN domain-containing protein